MRVPIALLLSLALALVGARSVAGTPTADKAAAQALFDEGLRLMTSGDARHACPKLEESQRLDPAMGTLFRLSECWEAIGRTASAWAAYVEVAELGRTTGQSSREKLARERAARLEPSLSYVEIDVALPAPTGLDVRRDGLPVGAGQWGTPIPVDPGQIRVTAVAPKKTSWAVVVTAAAGGRIVVRVPTLADAPAEVFAPAPNSPVPDAASVHTESPAPSSGGTQKTVGAILFGAGAAAILGSGVLGLVAVAEYHGTGAHCTGDVCDADGKRATDAARTIGDIATVVFGAGAAIAVGGGIMWLVAPAPRTPVQTAWHVSLRPKGIAVEGGF
jgi:serine/threonine-protein kinase